MKFYKLPQSVQSSRPTDISIFNEKHQPVRLSILYARDAFYGISVTWAGEKSEMSKKTFFGTKLWAKEGEKDLQRDGHRDGWRALLGANRSKVTKTY